jgi:hypothetical protein
MTSIINAIPTYLVTVVVSTVFVLLLRVVHNFIHQQALHSKTKQSQALWSLMGQIADTAVASLVSADKTGDQKFTAATAIVQDALTKQGFTTVDVKAIEAAVQAAYEKSPLTSSKTDMQWTSICKGPTGPEGKAGAYGTAVAIDPKEAE